MSKLKPPRMSPEVLAALNATGRRWWLENARRHWLIMVEGYEGHIGVYGHGPEKTYQKQADQKLLKRIRGLQDGGHT